MLESGQSLIVLSPASGMDAFWFWPLPEKSEEWGLQSSFVSFLIYMYPDAFSGAETKTQLFSGTLFPVFLGGCPTKNGLPQKGFPFFFQRH